ncbi:serine/threonine protein kinase [Spirulina subsalsa FACHB-351]|uniref:non-specific serine/threonine protein kinase n=1 Tax=Spirulina subsalsa FACHB-351 TaxID=234711 RepID=A0ABT3L483_9CYAN|nr:serine/threonine-protein kinase [Spirulina subsalsa]MCW6036316.1 serine/threonine protein kinase [Spirulina subsalsa FACHB-351]
MMQGLHGQGEMIRDHYQIVTVLGQGSMGTTYAAVDVNTSQRVAIKVVSLRQASEWKTLELFEREARVLATLTHPNIPNYIEYFQVDTPEDRRFYLVQELVEGSSLEALIEQGWKPTEDEVKAIALQVLEILTYLHTLNPPVIHRDIKPQNLIQSKDGRIILVDFGAVQEVYRKTISRGGTLVGTFGYMAPEQFRGQTTYASDLYGLGTTLVYLLTRKIPADLPEKRMKIDFRSAITVSDSFGRWLDKMIEPALEDRFREAVSAQKALVDKLPITRTTTEQNIPKSINEVFLQKTPDLLKLYIPGNPWNLGSGLLFLLYVGWTIPASIILVLAILGESWGLGEFIFLFLCFILPAWGISCALWVSFRSLKGDNTLLKINRNRFQFRRQLLLFNEVIEGNTEFLEIERESDPAIPHLSSLSLNCSKRLGRLYIKSFGIKRLYNKPLKQKIAEGLDLAEKEWLAEELKSFLRDVKAKNLRPESQGSKVNLVKSSSSVGFSSNVLEYSRIQLTKTQDRLTIDVPSLIPREQTGFWLIFMAVLLFLSFPIFLFILIPFILIPLAVIRSNLFWSTFGSFHLEINPETFHLSWQYGSWSHHIKGKTEELQHASLSNTTMTVNEQPVKACALDSKNHHYLFGSWLKQDEKEILILEINRFLEETRR